jgi:hypothetical protein
MSYSIYCGSSEEDAWQWDDLKSYIPVATKTLSVVGLIVSLAQIPQSMSFYIVVHHHDTADSTLCCHAAPVDWLRLGLAAVIFGLFLAYGYLRFTKWRKGRQLQHRAHELVQVNEQQPAHISPRAVSPRLRRR